MKKLFLILFLLSSEILMGQGIVIPSRASDGRQIVATNRIPDGYTMFFTGASDDITNNTTGGGTELKLSNSINSVTFQIKSPWYVVGGRAVGSSITIGDYVEAKMIAPATTGLTQATGDFNKVEIIPSSGLYMIVPVATDAGSWDMDLTAKIGSSSVTKATPVPNKAKTGWFKYDTDTNVISACSSQICDYDLFDFDVEMFWLCKKCWINPNGETSIESSDVVAKQMLPQWKIVFTSSISSGGDLRIILNGAVKGN